MRRPSASDYALRRGTPWWRRASAYDVFAPRFVIM
jgi:hypothetical protein